MTPQQFVRHVQQRLAAHGHYTMRVDGLVGPGTLAALDKAIPPLVALPRLEEPSKLTEASESRLEGVHEVLASLVREASHRSPTPFSVIEGKRTPQRQAQLVAAGASKTSNSRHLTGHAVDLWPIDPSTGRNLPSDAAFPRGSAEASAASARLWSDLRKIAAVVREVARERGVMVEWGGDWGWDAPHFQLNRAMFA